MMSRTAILILSTRQSSSTGFDVVVQAMEVRCTSQDEIRKPTLIRGAAPAQAANLTN
jgi:hypothetical protein